MADGALGAVAPGLPAAAGTDLDLEAFHALAQRDVLLEHHAVEGLAAGELEFDVHGLDIVVRGEIGVIVPVQHLGRAILVRIVAADGRCRGGGPVGQVRGEHRLPHLRKRLDDLHFLGVDDALVGRRHVHQEHGVASDALVIEVHQLLRRLPAVVRAVEPAVVVADLLDGEVALGRTPGSGALVAGAQVGLIVAWQVARGEPAARDVQGRPVGLSGDAGLVAHPAAAGAAVGEDDALRIGVEDDLVHGRPVEVPGVVAVEPHLHDGRVFRHQVLEGVLVHLLVLGRALPGHFDHPVPGGEVDAHVHAVLVAGVAEGLEHVRVVRAAGVGHVRRALGIVPEAEAVVVLGGDDDLAEAVVLGGLHPLVRVDGRGLVVLEQEALGPGFSVAVGILAVPAGEGGLAVVVEHQQLLALPGELPFRGHGAIGGRRARVGGRGRGRRIRRRATLHRDGAGGGEAAVHRRGGDDGRAGGDGLDLAVLLAHRRDGFLVGRPRHAGVGGVFRADADAEMEPLSHVEFQAGPGDAHPGHGNGIVLLSG